MRAELALLVLITACGGSGGNGDSRDGGMGGDGGDGGSVGNGDGGDGCNAPDMLIALDRTMSMHRLPNGMVPANTPEGRAGSKWHIAVNSVEAVTAELEGTVRFGLVAFPLDPGGDVCVTVEERISGDTATNNDCEAADVEVPTGAATAGMIAAAIDPDQTQLCTSTPIGAAMVTTGTELERVQISGREQYVVLLTDGQDTCDGAEDPDAIEVTQALAQDGIKSYVIGFDASGTGIDPEALNHLACAGQTATNFPEPCTDEGGGNYLATDPDGEVLYLSASDAESLTASLSAAAAGVCCGCVD